MISSLTRKQFYCWQSQWGNDFVAHRVFVKIFNIWISLPYPIRFLKISCYKPFGSCEFGFCEKRKKISHACVPLTSLNLRSRCKYKKTIIMRKKYSLKSTKSSTLKTIFINIKESLTWVSCQALRSLRRCSGHRRRIPRWARGRSTTSSSPGYQTTENNSVC